MKKHFLLFTVALACGLYAQAQQKTSFGLKAGFSAANFSLKDDDGYKEKTKTLPAFHGGVIVDIPLDDQLSLQPGLFFSQKGAKLNGGDTDSAGHFGTASFRISYLELPVNLVYKYQVGTGKLFAGIGVYAAYGVGGKVKATQGNVSVSVPVKFKGDADGSDMTTVYVKPFDAGANFMIGYELKMGLLFSVNYSLGLVNTDPYPKETQKQRYFGVSVGYLFK